jgi:hypothetical protein
MTGDPPKSVVANNPVRKELGWRSESTTCVDRFALIRSRVDSSLRLLPEEGSLSLPKLTENLVEVKDCNKAQRGE